MKTLTIILTVSDLRDRYEVALNSIFSQKESEQVETIVVVDGENDSLVQKLKQFPVTKIVTQIQAGVHEARLTGVKHATREFIVFLDSDDILSPVAISTWRRAQEKTQAQIVIGKSRYIHNKKKWLMPVEDDRYFFFTRAAMKGKNLSTMHGVMVERELLLKLPSHETTWFSDLFMLTHLASATGAVTHVEYVVYGSYPRSTPLEGLTLYQQRNESTLRDALSTYERLNAYLEEQDDMATKQKLDRWFKNYISRSGRKFLLMEQNEAEQNQLFKQTADALSKANVKSRYLTLWKSGNRKRFNLYSKMIQFKRSVSDFKKRSKKWKLEAYALFQKMPVKQNVAVFESFLGRSYSDSPKAIYEQLKKDNPSVQGVWIFSGQPPEGTPEDLKWVKKSSLAYYYTVARAKYWVFNTRQPLSVTKRPETVYLQTWHGTPLKRLGLDMEEVYMAGTNTVQYKRNFYNQAQEWDYLISPNRYSSEIFKSCFGFQNEMLEIGYPRNDLLYAPDKESKMTEIKERLNIPLDKKVVLYAPTWRDDEFIARGKYNFDLRLNLADMQTRLGDEYVILLRMHYLIAQAMDTSKFEGFAYDVSHYRDISELYLVSDALITDYSSVFFDYAHLKRPILFFTYDLEKYQSTLRGFYFDFEQNVPGPLLQTSDEVIDALADLDALENKYAGKYELFSERFCHLDDGSASKRAIAHVFEGKPVEEVQTEAEARNVSSL